MERYDEDLSENAFYQVLKSEYPELYTKVIEEGWILCIPRAGSLPKYAFSQEDFFNHILIPSEELPQSHFRTLNDREVKISRNVITVENDISNTQSVHILFEETFYSIEMQKYKVICLERPLEGNLQSGQTADFGVYILHSLRDCIDLLWTETGGQKLLEQLDELIKIFRQNNRNLEVEQLQTQIDLAGALYTQALQITLKDTRIREKIGYDKHFLESVQLAVETYILHGIYKKLINGVTACTAYDDSYLNKIIKNLFDIQLRDLDIRQDLNGVIPRAKQELAQMDRYSTPLGKLGCVRRAITTITKQYGKKKDINTSGNFAISADDLLPVLVFLVIKTGLPNWVAHLTFMKQFRLSSACSDIDENAFYVTSIEAAIEHVKSGVLLGSVSPEALHDSECEETSIDSPALSRQFSEKDKNVKSALYCLFSLVREGDSEGVKDILEKPKKESETKEHDRVRLNMCHPLCSCDRCESAIAKSNCDTVPTVHSCDDRGFTALHVACLFGRPKIVDLLLNYKANVNGSDFQGATPLHHAAARGHQNALLLLLYSEADMNATDNDFNTPLHLATLNGHEGCVKALLYYAEHIGQSLNINAVNVNGDTALHHAARWGYESIVEILLNYKAAINIENKRHLTPQDCAHSFHVSSVLEAAKNKAEERMQGFVEVNIAESLDVATSHVPSLDLTVSPETECSFSKHMKSLAVPASPDEMKKVEKLLQSIVVGDIPLASYYLGINSEYVKTPDIKNLCHPLCTCDNCGPLQEDSSFSAVGYGLSVNVCSIEGFTPLHVAAMHGQCDIVKMVLRNGANLNVQTRIKGCTPLHLACQSGKTVVVQLLLEAHCLVNVQDKLGNTPLHYSCMNGKIELVNMLLKQGAKTEVHNSNGRTPLQEAEERCFVGVVDLLQKIFNREKMN